MISVNFLGQMGNNLFQYSTGRLLAERLNYRLSANGICNFPGTFEKIDGNEFSHPIASINDDNFDFEKLISDTSDRKIELNGYFQRSDFMWDNRHVIYKFLEQPNIVDIPVLDTVVHVRLGDYLSLDMDLPYSFYDQALQIINKSNLKVWIATDEPHHPFFFRFKAWRPNFINARSSETFLLMRRARNLIISRSIFSWWAAFLGQHDTVIGPKPKTGFWSKHELAETKLSLVDERIFTPIEYDENRNSNYLEKSYYILRESDYWIKKKSKQIRKIFEL